jgi:hypothetical protein
VAAHDDVMARRSSPRRQDVGGPAIKEASKNDRPEDLRVTKCKEKITGREKTLISSSIYHVTNNTCIHLKTRNPNIYMYMIENIYKELSKNTKNIKS